MKRPAEIPAEKGEALDSLPQRPRFMPGESESPLKNYLDQRESSDKSPEHDDIDAAAISVNYSNSDFEDASLSTKKRKRDRPSKRFKDYKLSCSGKSESSRDEAKQRSLPRKRKLVDNNDSDDNGSDDNDSVDKNSDDNACNDHELNFSPCENNSLKGDDTTPFQAEGTSAVQDEIAVINGCPVFRQSKKGLTISEILEICVCEKVQPAYVCRKVPQAVRENAVFVVDIKDAVPHRDLTADDNGYTQSTRPRVKKYAPISEMTAPWKEYK
ncbi:hypothetical protein OS493_012286 [Desmophyllum pertusum]|uniref:Uncharacterized protein n=1 Tax=Desmophyllum pertusum TaxID=174260 RepID=A0A9W9ZQ95_9CNID|nr:hypothetical protein OS493_012286 [Desmophyllum pertusum]